MNRANKALVIAVVATFGLWGCARGPVPGGGAERVKSLEGKISKIEEDYKATAAARDQVKQRLAAAEEQRTRLQQEIAQLQLAVKERDELKKQMVVRTGERDAVQNQFEQFRKNIRDLLGHAEAATGTAQPVTAEVLTATQGKS